MYSFGEWLESELKKRRISKAELGRRIGVSRQAVSNWIHAGAGQDVGNLEAVADALGIPVETVYKKAGILSPKTKPDEVTEQLVHIFTQLPEHDRQELVEMARAKLERWQALDEQDKLLLSLIQIEDIDEFTERLTEYLRRIGAA